MAKTTVIGGRPERGQCASGESMTIIILETERLILRRLLPDDLDDLFALYRDPEIRRYFPEGTLTYEETRDELEFFLNGHPDHPELGLATG